MTSTIDAPDTTPRPDGSVPIRLLHDRVLVRPGADEGERRSTGGIVIPAVPYWKIPPRFYRQQVVDPTGEAPGTVVVDTPNRFLYLVEPGGTAMRMCPSRWKLRIGQTGRLIGISWKLGPPSRLSCVSM